MKKIELTKGHFALVDDDDFERINSRKWHYHSTGYAFRTQLIDGKKTLIRMHREVMRPPKHLVVDHINRNGLDNRKTNLRLATMSQNQHNRIKCKNNTSGFKGVSRNRDGWRARITVDWKEKHLGTFLTPELAAQAYEEAAKKYHGNFANYDTPKRGKVQVTVESATSNVKERGGE